MSKPGSIRPRRRTDGRIRPCHRLRGELRDLRARAYGPNPDIQDDPDGSRAAGRTRAAHFGRAHDRGAASPGIPSETTPGTTENAGRAPGPAAVLVPEGTESPPPSARLALHWRRITATARPASPAHRPLRGGRPRELVSGRRLVRGSEAGGDSPAQRRRGRPARSSRLGGLRARHSLRSTCRPCRSYEPYRGVDALGRRECARFALSDGDGALDGQSRRCQVRTARGRADARSARVCSGRRGHLHGGTRGRHGHPLPGSRGLRGRLPLRSAERRVMDELDPSAAPDRSRRRRAEPAQRSPSPPASRLACRRDGPAGVGAPPGRRPAAVRSRPRRRADHHDGVGGCSSSASRTPPDSRRSMVIDLSTLRGFGDISEHRTVVGRERIRVARVSSPSIGLWRHRRAAVRPEGRRSLHRHHVAWAARRRENAVHPSRRQGRRVPPGSGCSVLMPESRTPFDAELELRALHARAYGPEPDIQDDPAALARLVELGSAHAAEAAIPRRATRSRSGRTLAPAGTRRPLHPTTGLAPGQPGASIAARIATARLWLLARPSDVVADSPRRPRHCGGASRCRCRMGSRHAARTAAGCHAVADRQPRRTIQLVAPDDAIRGRWTSTCRPSSPSRHSGASSPGPRVDATATRASSSSSVRRSTVSEAQCTPPRGRPAGRHRCVAHAWTMTSPQAAGRERHAVPPSRRRGGRLRASGAPGTDLSGSSLTGCGLSARRSHRTPPGRARHRRARRRCARAASAPPRWPTRGARTHVASS